jgi:hypothetical protein
VVPPSISDRVSSGVTLLLAAFTAKVVGRSDDGIGVLGESKSTVWPGVMGRNEHGPGVRGESTEQAGVEGESDRGPGVYGVGKFQPGVRGKGGNVGVEGFSTGGFGVVATGDYGMLAARDRQASAAGLFWGDVRVMGNLSVSSGIKQFLIDHPLDPEHRYLCHASVEAPALKTLYDGTVDLDPHGEARVELPPWFAALNTDLCYVLTAVGGPAPELHVAHEFDGTGFGIAGGRAGGRVSWQVTGVRDDPGARAHPLVVEREKEDDEVGRFLEPDAHGAGNKALPWIEDAQRRIAEIRETRTRDSSRG